MVSKFVAGLGVIAGITLLIAVSGCVRTESVVLGSGKANPPVRVDVASVRFEDSVRAYESTGTVKPKFNSTLSSKVMARVTSVAVREGDRVRKGQVVVTLDSRELQSAVGMAQANQKAAAVSIRNAQAAYSMEIRTSSARVAEAEAQVAQARSALGVAKSRRDLALAGTRTQEKAQASLAVAQAASNLKFATTELERTRRLVDEGALARRQLDIAQNAYNQAKAQHDTALEAEKIVIEGSRTQEIRAAEEAVGQAEAAVKQAEAGLRSARASGMLVKVREGDIQAAKAQANQSTAALQSVQATAGYATVIAPFDGRVVKRFVDPGSMATPGAPLLVVEGEDLRLEALVPEAVVGSIGIGSTAPIYIESTGAEFTAKVVEVVPQGDSASHTYVARYALPRDARLKTGMFGRVQIPIGRQKKILIPASASWEVEGLQYVFVLNPEKVARLRIITVGAKHGDRLQVLTGLNEGEQIVVGDRSKIDDGTLVEAN